MDTEQVPTRRVLILYAPMAIMGGMMAAKGISGGINAGKEMNATADQLKDEQTALAVQRSRDITDMKAAGAAALAQRAVRVAALGAAGTAQGTELTSSVAATSALGMARYEQDYEVKRTALRARIKNLKNAAKMAPLRAVLDPLNLFNAGGAIAQQSMAGGAEGTPIKVPTTPYAAPASNTFSMSSSSGSFGSFG